MTNNLVLFVCCDHVVNPLVSVQHQHWSRQFPLLLVYQPVFIGLVKALQENIVVRIRGGGNSSSYHLNELHGNTGLLFPASCFQPFIGDLWGCLEVDNEV